MLALARRHHHKAASSVFPSSFSSGPFLRRALSTSSSSSSGELPSSADVVVIGGGVMGCSTLYHLSLLGVQGLLLEKDALTAGTTWHSAGLMWRLRPNDVDIQMMARSRELAKPGGILEQETGLSTGWTASGGLFVANTPQRLDEYKRLHTIGKYFGLDSDVLSPSETKELYPLMNVEDVTGTLHSHGDGAVEPADYTAALARASRQRGQLIREGVRVTGFETTSAGCRTDPHRQKITGVVTDKGLVRTEKVVLAGGVWSRDLAASIGVKVPLVAMRHAYVITDKIPGVKTMPCVRDHDLSIYLRVQGEALQVGGYEPNPIFWDDVEPDFAFSLFELDYDSFGGHLLNASHRVPIVGDTGIKSEVCGPESFTPDHKPLIGPTPEMDGLYLGCAFNSAGMNMSGGCGQQLAEWVTYGYPSLEMFHYDIMRYHPKLAGDAQWIRERSHESYAKNYSIVFPNDEPLAARGKRQSFVHDLLLEQGCIFQERHGFERAGWFAKDGKTQPFLPYDYYGAYEHTEKHQEYNYRDKLAQEYTFDYASNHNSIREEVRACRDAVAVFDQSYFGQFFVRGPDAVAAMEWVCCNAVDKPVGGTTYTEMLNEAGGVECDLGVHRTGEHEFYITAGGASSTRDWHHIRRVIHQKGFDCVMENVSDVHAMFSVMGPKSRTLLERLTDAALDNESFPFATNQVIKIQGKSGEWHSVRAIRLTFVGELGWELHVPEKSARDVYQALFEAGEDLGVKPAGYRAIDSLSCQKGYLHAHEDARISDNPVQAGVAFIVNTKLKDPERDFLGKDALLRQQKEGLKKRLVHVRVPRESIPEGQKYPRLHPLAVIYRDGEFAGFLRRAAFDYDTNETIGTAYVVNREGEGVVSPTFVRGSEKQGVVCPEYKVEVLGKCFPCTVSLKSSFDPKSERVHGNYPKPQKSEKRIQVTHFGFEEASTLQEEEDVAPPPPAM